MITSLNNPKLKTVRKLMENARFRRETGAFVVEGERIFREIPGGLIIETYVSESFKKKLPKTKGEIVSDRCFAKLSDTETPQGILAVVRCKKYSLPELIKGREGLFIILEGLQDPGNLGTIVRTGEAAGITCLIADRKTADIYSPKTVRSTMGSIFRVPVIYTHDLAGTMDVMKKAGVTIYAADLKGKDDYYHTDYKRKSAFVIGNEGKGLSPEISGLADVRLKIPMKGKVESLNAAVSAAILMYGYQSHQEGRKQWR